LEKGWGGMWKIKDGGGEKIDIKNPRGRKGKLGVAHLERERGEGSHTKEKQALKMGGLIGKETWLVVQALNRST